MSSVMIRSVLTFRSGIRTQRGRLHVTAGRNISQSASMKEFDPFRLDTGNQCLWRRGNQGYQERILVRPKAFDILQYLVDRAGRLATQAELLDAIWPNTYVQPEVLKRHMVDIRNLLGDDPKRPTYIETRHRRGYQFIAAVRNSVSSDPSTVNNPAQIKLVGRDRALIDLRTYFELASGGQQQIVFVTGGPGIGKTTLVDEFQQRIAGGNVEDAARAPIRIARGQCVEGNGVKDAYYPLLDALENLCRGSAETSVFQVLAAQAPTWLCQFPSLIKTQGREIPADTRQRMLREIGDALETIASDTPLLLVLENLHWADRSTVDFISTLARGRRAAKLMVIGTYSPVDLVRSNHPLQTLEQDLLVNQLCHELALERRSKWKQPRLQSPSGPALVSLTVSTRAIGGIRKTIQRS